MRSLLSIFLCSILLCSCFGQHAMQHPEQYLNASAFPSDIKKDGYVLLVQKMKSNISGGTQNRRVSRLMRKNYDKPFEMVSAKELNSNPEYSDKSKYRYLLKKLDKNGGMSQTVTRSTGMTTITYSDMVIEDRLTGKVYPKTGHPTNTFEEAMKVVAPYLGKMK